MIEDSKKEIKKVKRATIFTGLAMFFIAIFSIFKSFFDQERRK